MDGQPWADFTLQLTVSLVGERQVELGEETVQALKMTFARQFSFSDNSSSSYLDTQYLGEHVGNMQRIGPVERPPIIRNGLQTFTLQSFPYQPPGRLNNRPNANSETLPPTLSTPGMDLAGSGNRPAIALMGASIRCDAGW